MHTEKNTSYGPNPRHKADIYLPANSSDTIFIFWPGGSWKSGNKDLYRFIGPALAGLGYIVIIPNYRLYPEVEFPGFVEDGAMVTDWAAKKFQPNNIFLAGHSAGAYIAAMLAADLNYLDEKTAGHVRGLIAISGPYDFNPRPDLKPIFEKTDKKIWNVVNRVNEESVANTLLVHGRLDNVVSIDNAKSMIMALAKVHKGVKLINYSFFEHLGILIPFFWPFWKFSKLRREIRDFIAKTIE